MQTGLLFIKGFCADSYITLSRPVVLAIYKRLSAALSSDLKELV